MPFARAAALLLLHTSLAHRPTRRRALRAVFHGAALAGAPAAALVAAPAAPAAAREAGGDFPLLSEGAAKRTPLTSKPLEWLRVADQREADETLGELADPGAAQTAARLAEVVRLGDALRALGADLGTAPGWRRARAALAAPAFQPKAFKRAFNAYSDNVYYAKADPDRANLYLLGGAPPSTAQTVAYLHRNDALDNVDRLRAELDYLLESGGDGGPDDARAFWTAATAAFDAYFDLCDPADRRAARALVGPGPPGPGGA